MLLFPSKTKGVIFVKPQSTNSIEKTLIMHIMDTFGFGLFVATLAYLSFNWSTIPAQIPTYFGLKGEIHRYGSKWELLLFPIIIFLTGAALQLLEKHPDWHYSPIKITDTKMEQEVKQSVFMISFIKNMSSLLLALLIWETIHIAQGNNAELEGVIWLLVATIIILPTMMTVISALKE